MKIKKETLPVESPVESKMVEPAKEVIAKLAVDMGREDLNQLVMKLNEVIDRINKVEN